MADCGGIDRSVLFFLKYSDSTRGMCTVFQPYFDTQIRKDERAPNMQRVQVVVNNVQFLSEKA